MNNELQKIIILLHKEPRLSYMCNVFLKKDIGELKDIRCRGVDCEQCILDCTSRNEHNSYTIKLIKVIRQI